MKKENKEKKEEVYLWQNVGDSWFVFVSIILLTDMFLVRLNAIIWKTFFLDPLL